MPQVQALVECRAAADGRVPLIADGGVKRDGALVQALLFGGDTVMLGSALAGTTETPGDIVQKPVVIPESHKTVKVPFKVFRGMASLQAIVDRLDVEDAEAADVEALGAEGMEISVPARGSVRPVLRDMLKHLCSAISYGGARSLASCRRCSATDPAALRHPPDRVEPARVVRIGSGQSRTKPTEARRHEGTPRLRVFVSPWRSPSHAICDATCARTWSCREAP